MSTLTPARAALAGLSAVVLALSLSGCSILSDLTSGGGPDRDEDGAVAATEEADVFSLKVGDCLNEASGSMISDVEFVPCGEPHDWEVYAETEVEGSELPADIDTQAENYCVPQFESFVGLDYNSSALEVTWFVPSEQSWSSGDKLITCIVLDPAGQTTGSLAGAAR
ncbi:hypothetical protein HNR16_000163 [Pseudoclavibacter chungangensis]|nr:septum formation family protein [Pseudoclavibacter chungangensis]NYJ65375.1 hypothetical protein [Pseudoclavibacter chungangensis]